MGFWTGFYSGWCNIVGLSSTIIPIRMNSDFDRRGTKRSSLLYRETACCNEKGIIVKKKPIAAKNLKKKLSTVKKKRNTVKKKPITEKQNIKNKLLAERI